MTKNYKWYCSVVVLGLSASISDGAILFSLTSAEQQYAVIANNFNIDNASTDIFGDVGVKTQLDIQNGFIRPSAPFTGAAYFPGAVSCVHDCSHVLGGNVANTAAVTTAISDYNALAVALVALSANASLGAISGGNLTSGVYDATTITLDNSHSLTLDAGGDPNAQFVIRFTSFNVSGSGAINLVNGATPDNVIFLYTGSANVNWGGSGTFNGLLLDADSSTSHNVNFTNSSLVNGRVVYTNGTVGFNNADLNETVASGVPEPSTLGLIGLGGGLIGCGFLRKRA